MSNAIIRTLQEMKLSNVSRIFFLIFASCLDKDKPTNTKITKKQLQKKLPQQRQPQQRQQQKDDA